MAILVMCLVGVSLLARFQIGAPVASAQARQAPVNTSTHGDATLVPPVEFEHISVEQGLSQSIVYAILQDRQGFLWFGTEDGLNRYDGQNFVIFRHDPEDPNTLSDNTVWQIYQDGHGELWIGTDGGLNRLDPTTYKFTRYQHDPTDPHSLSHNSVGRIYEDTSGTLWIGTWGGGLNRFDRQSGKFSAYRHDQNDAGSLSHDTVGAILEDDAGNLWVGTWGGLDKLDANRGTFEHYRHDPNDPASLSFDLVRSLAQDETGAIWVGTAGGGLDKLDPQTRQFIHLRTDPDDPTSLSDDIVWEIYQDQLGEWWIITDNGLNRFDRDNHTFTRYQHDPDNPTSLSNNVIYSIFQDREGLLWLGTAGGGLNRLDRNRAKFARYQHIAENPNSLSHNDVRAIWEDSDGNLWIGTSDGLNKLERDTGQFSHYHHAPDDPTSLSSDEIISLLQDSQGSLWVGTLNGLNRMAPGEDRFVHIFARPDDPSGLSSNSVRAIFQDQQGQLWFGTGRGLDLFEPRTSTFSHYRPNPADPHGASNVVQVIYQDQANMLWLGTRDGLYRFDPDKKRFTRYQRQVGNQYSLSNNHILALLQDRNGTLWVGTHSGLNRLQVETESFIRYREQDGLPNDVIYGILEDAQGYLWLSTNNGLSRFDPIAETFRNYSPRDGLQSNEFNRSAFQSPSGEMFFGGIGGFNAFFPHLIQDNPFVPPIVLVSLTQSGAEIPLTQIVETVSKVTLHWPNNFFEFEFAALSFAHPEKNQYAYKLENFERDWNYVGNKRFGRYTNLPGGTYILRIKGSNNDGIWNHDGAAIKIVIVPAFWATWWFRGIAALALLGVIAGGYTWRVKIIEARNRELENQVHERTSEIERRRQELEALYRADAELHRHLSLDQVLQALVDIAVDILQADKSSLMTWDEGHEKLVMRVARGFEPETLAQISFIPGQGTAGHVAATGQPAIIQDARTDPRVGKRASIIDPEGIRSFMQIPIQVGGEVFGVFSADYTRTHAFGPDEQRLFVALAQRAALAIDTAQLYEQTQELAVMEERNRLARDLHDAVTQTLFSASLIAEALPTLWENDQQEGRALLQEMRQLSRGALAEMRTLLLELRPTALSETSLEDLLRQLAAAITGRTGIPVEVTIDDPSQTHAASPLQKENIPLATDVHVAFYRITQEALNNVVKHARASHVQIALRYIISGSEQDPSITRVELGVRDDGCGFDPAAIPPDRLGLNIMRERARSVGATIAIKSAPEQGTWITVVWEQANPQTDDP